MTAPRLEIRLDHIGVNARHLVTTLARRGIAVCGVTKATLGSPEVAATFVAAGVGSLGDARIDNVERLRHAGQDGEILLIRSPMISEADRVITTTTVSANTELAVIAALGQAAHAHRRRHGVLLMVELGDLREGIVAGELMTVTREVLNQPGIELRGLGTNLACQNGVVPGPEAMAELSGLAEHLERTLGIGLPMVSGGNSANLAWALDRSNPVGRINHLRLGEAILLGREPLHRTVLPGLHTDAFCLVGEVIEAKSKPAAPWGDRAQSAFGEVADGRVDQDRPAAMADRVIVALGRQDVDPDGLQLPDGFTLAGASSDHLVLHSTGRCPEPGAELRFGVDYSALLRAMTSPFVTKVYQPAA